MYQRVEMISADGFTGPVDEEQSNEAFYHLQTQDQAFDSIGYLENKRTANWQKGLVWSLSAHWEARVLLRTLSFWGMKGL